MQLDRYTKVVLTVIALALVYICVALTAGTPVQAQSEGSRVIVAGWIDETGTVRAFPRYHLNPKIGPLPVSESK